MPRAKAKQATKKVAKRKYKRYSDEDKANALLALQANGNNLLKTSKELKMPLNTLAQWHYGNGVHPVVTEICNERRPALVERLDDAAHLLLDNLPHKIDGAGLQQLAVAMGIVLDKSQLLKGEPTSISRAVMSDEQRIKRIRELVEEAEQRVDPVDAPAASGSRAAIAPPTPVEPLSRPAENGVHVKGP